MLGNPDKSTHAKGKMCSIETLLEICLKYQNIINISYSLSDMHNQWSMAMSRIICMYDY